MALTVSRRAQRVHLNPIAFSLLTFALAAMLALLIVRGIEVAPERVAARPYWDMWAMVAVSGLAGLLALLYALPLTAPRKLTLALGGLSLLMVAVVALALKGTPYPFDGIEADQRFYAAFVTRLAAHPGYADVSYAGLSAFYPPLYFWLLARLANLWQVEPYLTMKSGLLLTAFLMPWAVSWVWGRTLSYPFAVGAAFVMLFYQEWFKTAEWLSLVLFIPWWIHWVENGAARVFDSRQARLRWWLVGAFLGSLIFQTYYYWFFLGGVSLTLQLFRAWLRPDACQRVDARNALAVLALTALFSAPYWLPYLADMARTGGWEPLQNRWLSESKIPLPFPFLEGSIEGVLLAAGLVYLALTAQERLSRGLLFLVGAVYVWGGLGYVAMLLERPLLTFRAYTMVEQVLATAAALGMVRLWQYVSQPRAGATATLSAWTARLRPAVPITTGALLLFFAQESALGFLKDDMVATARATTYPRELLSNFDALTGGDLRGKTILLGYGYRDLAAYRPVSAFLPWSAHFSHPAGLYRARVAFLEELAATNDPDLFAAALMNNRYAPIDSLLLEREDTSWRFGFLDDNFPDRTVERAFSFDEVLFVEPYFASRTEGGLTLITLQPQANPLATIDLAALAAEPLDTVALLYTLVSTFGGHVDLPDYEATRDEAERALLNADLSELSPETLLSLQLAAGGELHDKASAALESKVLHPLNVQLADEAGVARIRVIGFALQPRAQGNHQSELAIYMEALAPVERDYSIWVHADREGAQLNFDHTFNAPTSTWDVGKIYRDTYVLSTEPGTYHFSFGLWRSEDETRLRRSDGGIEIELGALTLP